MKGGYVPRILHTSDVQLDAPFRFLGPRGEEHRKQLRETFKRIVEMAQQDGFDLLLIAGDLFDSNRPHQTTLDVVSMALEQLDIPVCILPGNHDCYDDDSVYRRVRFPDHVHVFTEQPTVQTFPALDLAVYGNPLRSARSQQDPLRDLAPSADARWHVAMAHGNVDRPDLDVTSRPIRPEAIRDSGMDYVALGDWHGFADYSAGDVTACYAGAPEPTALGQTGAGYVARVELDDGGVRVRPERVGTITTDELTFDVTGYTRVDVVQAIREHADPHLMLQVTLTGLTDLGTVLELDALERELASDFYHLACADQSHPQIEAIAAEDYPEELVIGKFARLMQERIEQAESENERRRAEQALQLGIALLEGKEVL
jgi:DNA repair exonuclease SbcCD nuclease subunit